MSAARHGGPSRYWKSPVRSAGPPSTTIDVPWGQSFWTSIRIEGVPYDKCPSVSDSRREEPDDGEE